MTGKADFTQQEWELVLEGPPSAGMIVVTAQRGGTIRETLAIARAYVEARKQHGESELLDEIVAAKPELDHTRYHSVAELPVPACADAVLTRPLAAWAAQKRQTHVHLYAKRSTCSTEIEPVTALTGPPCPTTAASRP